MPALHSLRRSEELENKKKNKTLTGVVVSDKMQKTAVVEVLRLKKHPKYKKYYKSSRKFKAHNPDGQYHIGDKVIMKETRPMSKDKRWIIINKVD